MRIISGLDYTHKLKKLIKECYEEASLHPFETYIFIAENPSVVEQYFFTHTTHLLNIEIMSWSSFLHYQIIENHLTKHHVLSMTEMTYHLRHILNKEKFQCFQNDQPYPLIKEFIPLMKDFDLNHIEYDADTLIQPKLQDYIHLYHNLVQRLDDYTHITTESILEHCLLNASHRHIYIEADHLYQTRRQEIIHNLDKYNDVILLYTYQNDKRLLNMPYHAMCQEAITDDSHTFLTDHLFMQAPSKYDKDMNFYTFISSTPHLEVKKVIYTIYQNIVDHHLKYEDFMIVYPNSTYLPLLLDTLTSLNIPHNLPIVSSCQYDTSYKKIMTMLNDEQESTFEKIAKTFMQEDLDKDYIEYFELLLNYKDHISYKEFKDFFLATYLKNHSEKCNYQDHIQVCTIDQVKLSKAKHIYFLGMNETVFPPLIKDTALLLDEDIITLRNAHIPTPLTTTEQLGLYHNDILKAFLQPYLSMTFSYPVQTISGETLLESSLYKQLKTMFKMTTLPDHIFLPLDDYYLQGGQIIEKETLNHHIHEFIQSKNQVNPIGDIISNLYSPHLSVSQIETYNKCPFQYFIQYGLSIYPILEDKLMPNELGSLVHYVLSMNIDDNQDIDTLVETYLSKEENLKNKIHSSKVNLYFIEQLKKDLQITLTVLKRQLDISDFKVKYKEKKVQDNLAGMNFKGFVDRIDEFNHLVSIIDYKSSAKDIDLNLAMQGFNIQMLLYLKMVTKLYEKDAGAVLYFNTKKRILSSDEEMVAPLDEEEFYKQYRYGGYVIDDEKHTVIKALDPTFEKRSNIINVTYVKSRNEYKGQILTQSQLELLFEEIEKHIYELYTQMISGHIEIAPKGSDNNAIHMQVNPCHYCPYHSVCNFDVFYNDYTLVEMLDVEKKLGGDEDAV